MPDAIISQLTTGDIFWFANWPNGNVPRTGAIVYTIWDRELAFIYAGMSGRALTENSKQSGKGPFGRMESHANGRRSGDQFCVYVADRLLLPTLHNRLRDIADGVLSMDSLNKTYIRQNLGFRWVSVKSSSEAFAIEKRLKMGLGTSNKPLLNGI